MTREDHVGTLRRRAEVSKASATKLQQIIEDLQAEARIVADQSPAAGACWEPRFRAGQSVHQWWASWFKNEGPAPKVYSKNSKTKKANGGVVTWAHEPVPWPEATSVSTAPASFEPTIAPTAVATSEHHAWCGLRVGEKAQGD